MFCKSEPKDYLGLLVDALRWPFLTPTFVLRQQGAGPRDSRLKTKRNQPVKQYSWKLDRSRMEQVQVHQLALVANS